MKNILLSTIIGFLIIFSLVSCAPTTNENGDYIINKDTPVSQSIEKEMILMGTHEDIQVLKIIDNAEGIICYITINSFRYQPSNIFCIKQ